MSDVSIEEKIAIGIDYDKLTDEERAARLRVKEAKRAFGAAVSALLESPDESLREATENIRKAQAYRDDCNKSEIFQASLRKGKEQAARKMEASELDPIELEGETLKAMQATHGVEGLQKMLANQRKQRILSELKHLSVEELEAVVNVDKAQAELAKAQIKLAEYEQLAVEGKKDRLVQLALSNADLRKVHESRSDRIRFNQLKSGGGVTRIESGDGR